MLFPVSSPPSGRGAFFGRFIYRTAKRPFDSDSGKMLSYDGITEAQKLLIMDAKPKTLPHIPQLDGIRAIAVSIVLFSHFGFGDIIPGGFGVTLFFFLSGYLITTIMRIEKENTGALSLKDFYLRRTLRILPPLYLTMIFAGIVGMLGLIEKNYTVSGIFSQIFFYQNYSEVLNVGPGLPLPLWSLAVEEHFYLAFPLVFSLFYARTTPAGFAFFCALACGVALAFRVVQAWAFPDSMGLNDVMSHTRIDSILFGAILAVWNNPVFDRDAWKPKTGHIAGAILLLLFCFLFRDEIFRSTLRYTLQAMGLFVLFSFALQTKGIVYRLLSCTIAKVIGLYSYTIYLVHLVFVMAIGGSFTFLSHGMQIFSVIVCTFVYSWLMYTVVERPAARLRKRLHQGPGLLKAARL